MTKAEGAYLYDIDGNKYIDFLQAGGPTVLGSNPPKIREKVKELLDTCGPVTGLFHEYELKLAKLVCDTYPGVEFFRALNSGTEACMVPERKRVWRRRALPAVRQDIKTLLKWAVLTTAGRISFLTDCGFPEDAVSGLTEFRKTFSSTRRNFSRTILSL